MVLRKYGEAWKDPREEKLATNREVLFKVVEALRKGAYQLEHLIGKEMPRTWNITHLKFYYN